MLVFTRQQEEEIVIGGSIRVKVLEVGGGSVKLGIIAPREIDVHRAEVYAQIISRNVAAAQAATRTPQLARGAGGYEQIISLNVAAAQAATETPQLTRDAEDYEQILSLNVAAAQAATETPQLDGGTNPPGTSGLPSRTTKRTSVVRER
jgi:carbon storage regulator